MKKRNQLIILISLGIAFSCTNVNRKALENETKSDSAVIISTQKSILQSKPDSVSNKMTRERLGSMTYYFANDSLCQTLSITNIADNTELDIPQKLKFRLVLHDKLNNYSDRTFEGIASLFSPEESFADSTEEDGGDYFAADYNLTASNYKLKIRLETEGYEACVIKITAGDLDAVLGGYHSYMKEFPNEGVMKKGKCH
ncbi:MAG: hypothetical protein V4594_17770 [Bacteroidota bacterium]